MGSMTKSSMQFGQDMQENYDLRSSSVIAIVSLHCRYSKKKKGDNRRAQWGAIDVDCSHQTNGCCSSFSCPASSRGPVSHDTGSGWHRAKKTMTDRIRQV